MSNKFLSLDTFNNLKNTSNFLSSTSWNAVYLFFPFSELLIHITEVASYLYCLKFVSIEMDFVNKLQTLFKWNL